jgi:hypothetical protein
MDFNGDQSDAQDHFIDQSSSITRNYNSPRRQILIRNQETESSPELDTSTKQLIINSSPTSSTGNHGSASTKKR